MLSYTSLQKQTTKLIHDIEERKFSTYTNHLLTKEDKLFLDQKIIAIEKIMESIHSLNIWSGKMDQYVMRYLKALMLFSFFKELYITLDFASEYCLQKMRDTNPKALKKLENILQSPETWSVRIVPTDFLSLLLPKMSPEVRKIAKNLLIKQDSWKMRVWFDLGSFFNQMNTITAPHKKNIIKRIGLWMATQKIKRKDHGLITDDIINMILPKLEIGDIILTRWNWNLTNNSIPGFWKHMSMYVWNGDICEAVWTGIQRIDIGHLLLKNDYCLVLRTNFSTTKKQEAVSYVLDQIGKTYDFTFNYYCDSSAVCSALVTKAYLPENKYDEWLAIDLIWTNGAYTYPPNDLVKKMDSELHTKKEQLLPVVFIDASEKNLEATIQPPLNARKTWKRSRWCLMQK